MAESALPFPTPTRLRLADAIAAGHIRHYHWVNPQSVDTVRDVHVTARLAELVAAGLAGFGEREDPVLSWSTAVLTPDGMAWVTRARTAQFRNCERCNASAVLLRCCSSHDKNLCHRCYRQTHFVEVCVAGCSACAREGLPREMHYWESGPGPTSPEPGPPLAEAPTLTQIVEFLDPDGTLRAGHSTEDGAACTGICDSEPEGEHAHDCPNRTEGDA